MVNNCANPQCAKPLHYLREGRIFVFEVQERPREGTGKLQGHHLEHYWLCGACSMKFRIEHEKGGTGIRLIARDMVRKPVAPEKPSIVAMAS